MKRPTASTFATRSIAHRAAIAESWRRGSSHDPKIPAEQKSRGLTLRRSKNRQIDAWTFRNESEKCFCTTFSCTTEAFTIFGGAAPIIAEQFFLYDDRPKRFTHVSEANMSDARPFGRVLFRTRSRTVVTHVQQYHAAARAQRPGGGAHHDRLTACS